MEKLVGTGENGLHVFILRGLLIFACGASVAGCGAFGDDAGSICQPDSSVETENCFLSDRHESLRETLHGERSPGARIDSREDVRRVCNSPCTRAAELDIFDIEGLGNLKAFSRLEVVKNGIGIWRNGDLKTLNGLELEPAKLSISIQHNSSLESLNALKTIRRVEGMTILGNTSLDSLRGLHNVERIGNPEPKHISGFPNLKLRKNDLDNIDALGSATFEPGGWIDIRREDDLTTLAPLSGGITELFRVVITENDRLADLEGIDEVEEIRDKLSITRNPQLPSCLAQDVAPKVASPDNVQIWKNGGSDYEVCN